MDSRKSKHNEHTNWRRRSKTNQPENNPFDFKSHHENTEQFNSSGYNQQKEHQNIKRNSSNRQEQWRNKHPVEKNPDRPRTNNLDNRQEHWKNKHSINNSNDLNNIENNKDRPNDIQKFYFGFKRLEELCSKNTSEIIFVMNNVSNGFMDLFKQNKEPDWIFLLIKVCAKICSTEFTQSKIQLLTELTCNEFFNHLKSYILNTPTETNLKRCKNMDSFFHDCLTVFQTITTLFPRTAVEKLKEIVVSANIAITGIKDYSDKIKLNETAVDGMSELLQKLKDIKLTDDIKLKEKLVFDNEAQHFPPPENFRELSVYPTAIDLEVHKPFLRPNITKGAYHDVEHYLDVQFRLLREDFIAPLREGIQFYKEMRSGEHRRKKINNIRVYHNVEFQKKGEFVQDKNGHLILFNKNNKLKINWEMAKRFMYGSLLLFTLNEFETFFLGVVLERKVQLLKQGILIVELLEDARPLYNAPFTMVESEVFFEPYKCSMEVLKSINSYNFPMEKYIISASNDIDYPIYIDSLEDPCYLIDDLNKFPIMYLWPNKEQLGLDEMQYRAFKAALTHEFTIIQGPPGTGKTFIGLKIMKTIIKNLYDVPRVRLQPLSKPILVVCYTNHALDQFMEGILKFTKKVVRIGGQSKSVLIELFNLRNITRLYRRSATTNIGLRVVNERVKNIMSEIKKYRKWSEIISYNAGVLELSLLKNGMPKKYHYFFKNTIDLLSWLFQDYNYFTIDPVGFIQQVGKEFINRVFHSEQLLDIERKEEEEDEHLKYELDDPDLEFDTISHNIDDIGIYSITLDDIKQTCKNLLSETIRLKEESMLNINLYNEYEEANFNFEIMEKIHDYFEYMLNLNEADIDFPRSVQDLNLLNMKQRWALYFSWVQITKDRFEPKITEFEQSYTNVYKQYKEMRELENIEILNQMHVVALTTTGAAKHRIMLEGLESPIVVVEEAAEVLEAHIVSSLTRHCQHLILIGDHKQLRPSNAVYKLARDFNFDISLFERMVNNNVPCYTLGEQHRMRPEISSLIIPTIYPDLKNHISVHNRENIRGLTKDLFFLNHKIFENQVEEISSKSNDHEASFMIMFARHLLLQGYKTDQVTILTTYSGQLFNLRSLRKKHPILEGMKIKVVDNYQGEESDIILLSLVRSNEEGKVGFLKTENRICVALSRAKFGLYIMGNMDNLYNSGDLWKSIKKTLTDQDSYGDELTLECAIHSGIFTKVSKSEHFNMIMEGGCTMLCKSFLLCGHYCTSMCHSYDRDHEEMICSEPCNKSCDFNHPCKKLCFMECGKCMESVSKSLPCGHQTVLPCFVDEATIPCEEIVETVLEECGHNIKNYCHEKEPNCTFQCYDRLECGHACVLNCHKKNDPNHEIYKCLKPCENINKDCSLNHKCQKLCHEDCAECRVRVVKTLPCGHVKNDVPCGLKDDKIKCNFPCERRLTCNHKCLSKCFETCKPCKVKVKKVIPECGHSAIFECKSIPEQKDCSQKCERNLICGHKCKASCAKDCATIECKELVLQKTSRLDCGHSEVWVLCCDKDKEFRMDSQYLLDKCPAPCSQTLHCNDICKGTCGECKQGRLHIPCSEKCNKINPCNHTCKSPCKQRCPPCNQKCLYSCVHSKCTNNCGVPCSPCKEKCEWKCPHLKCTKRCGDICNRNPCYEPCNLMLPCGHECIGFCGDPCPPLCRNCDQEEVTTIFLGDEDEPDARFIYLEDCKHSIESKGLARWMEQNSNEIILKHCPLCKTPILKTQRFMNQVKVVLADISKIKQKLYGGLAVISCKKKDIIHSLNSLNNTFSLNFIGDMNKLEHVRDLWEHFSKPIIASLHYRGKNRNFSIPAKDIESLDFVINLFKSTSKYKKQLKTIKDRQMKQTVIDHFVWLLSVAFTYARQLSGQQKSDINLEMIRGARIMSLFELKSNEEYKRKVEVKTSNALEVRDLVENMEVILLSCRVYGQDTDVEIQTIIDIIQEKLDVIGIITDEEMRAISKAMATSYMAGYTTQDHWFKCSNGHIYCVTECGGPMQQSVCPECKVPIGGQNHRHVSGITVASEMNSAR